MSNVMWELNVSNWVGVLPIRECSSNPRHELYTACGREASYCGVHRDVEPIDDLHISFRKWPNILYYIIVFRDQHANVMELGQFSDAVAQALLNIITNSINLDRKLGVTHEKQFWSLQEYLPIVVCPGCYCHDSLAIWIAQIECPDSCLCALYLMP
jgi:hypothetical protein